MQDEKDRHQLNETIEECFQACPKCGQIWVVFGLQENEEYTCQSCRHRFFFSLAAAADAIQSCVTKR